MSQYHECPKDGCTARVSRRFLSCRAHWMQVSPATRAQVYAEYDRYYNGEENDYLAIRQQAIDEMNHPSKLPAKELRMSHSTP